MTMRPTAAKTQLCKLECPHCHNEWGEMRFGFNKANGDLCPVRETDIARLDGKKFKHTNGSITCPACAYEYTTWDLALSMLEVKGEEPPCQDTEAQGRLSSTSA